MTYRELYTRLLPALTHMAPDEALREAKARVRMLLEVGLGMTLTDIVGGKVSEIPENDQRLVEKMMGRLEKGEPVQYVLETADFAGRSFHVEPGVLIPRPETAGLVALAVDGLRRPTAAGAAPTMLDIGTGSGCIAVTAALECPSLEVTAWDVSETALRVASDNARRLGARVRVERQDVLDEAAMARRPSGAWDAVVSNPPYIARSEAELMSGTVLDYEPHVALFVDDDDPLCFYRAIARYARRGLRPGGGLFFEINPRYADALAAGLADAGWRDVTLADDDYGRKRYACARV